MEWFEIGISWNLKYYGFSICIGSIIGWTYWNDFVDVATSAVMETIGLTNTTSSTWML